jgi:antitoxin ParD1/3/4
MLKIDNLCQRRYGGGMNVSLSPELERFIHRKVATGLYSSASEVVREALRILQERDRLKDQDNREEIEEDGRGSAIRKGAKGKGRRA